MKKLADLDSPAVVIDAALLDKNLQAMQSVCDAGGTELWPHIKTHKMVPVLRRQLELGAVGATFAKLGEAEALLPSGVRPARRAAVTLQPGQRESPPPTASRTCPRTSYTRSAASAALAGEEAP